MKTAGESVDEAPVRLVVHLTQDDGDLGDLTLAKVVFRLDPDSGPLQTLDQ